MPTTAELTLDGQRHAVRLRNISESGTMVELPNYVMPGSNGTLAIQDGPQVVIRTVWWADGRCGLGRQDALAPEQPAKEIRCELQAYQLLAAVFQHLAELDHAAHDIGIAADFRTVANQLGALVMARFVGMAGQLDQFARVQYPTHALMPRFATAAQQGNVGIVDILAVARHHHQA